MKYYVLLTAASLFINGCTTLEQSLRLGASVGMLAGAATTYGNTSAGSKPPTLEEVGAGASIGLAAGLLTSYLIHQKVIEDREDSSRQTEIYFGDLPPSPFLIPQSNTKKGGR